MDRRLFLGLQAAVGSLWPVLDLKTSVTCLEYLIWCSEYTWQSADDAEEDLDSVLINSLLEVEFDDRFTGKSRLVDAWWWLFCPWLLLLQLSGK